MSDKNIDKIKGYAKQQSLEDTIGMILSNRIDYGGEQGGMVSVKRFNQVAKDLTEIFPQLKAIPLGAVVGVTERTYTKQQILDLVRSELTECFQDNLDGETLKDKIYTVHGYIVCALNRKQ